MSKVIYIAHYDTPNSTELRSYSPAAAAKIGYIADAIAACGHRVELISASNSLETRPCSGGSREISENVVLTTLPSLGRGGRLHNLVDSALFALRLHRYLMRYVQDGDTVLAYHSLVLMRTVKRLKKRKKIRLLLETEEIYGDVTGNRACVRRELRFFDCADAYIFPTALLDEKINRERKPSVLIHGTYRVEQRREERFDDGKIHCVYAGTLDPRKGGALAAAGAAQFLPETYHIHILGFGSTAQKETLLAEIGKHGGKRVSFEGEKKGEEFVRFLQRCDIGLSTQNPDADFNATSFPSKILTYMANGLGVVSIRIPAVETSAVGSLVTYYDSQTPQCIAYAIMSAAERKRDNRNEINALHERFLGEMSELLHESNAENQCDRAGL